MDGGKEVGDGGWSRTEIGHSLYTMWLPVCDDLPRDSGALARVIAQLFERINDVLWSGRCAVVANDLQQRNAPERIKLRYFNSGLFLPVSATVVYAEVNIPLSQLVMLHATALNCCLFSAAYGSSIAIFVQTVFVQTFSVRGKRRRLRDNVRPKNRISKPQADSVGFLCIEVAASLSYIPTRSWSPTCTTSYFQHLRGFSGVKW